MEITSRRWRSRVLLVLGVLISGLMITPNSNATTTPSFISQPSAIASLAGDVILNWQPSLSLSPELAETTVYQTSIDGQTWSPATAIASGENISSLFTAAESLRIRVGYSDGSGAVSRYRELTASQLALSASEICVLYVDGRVLCITGNQELRQVPLTMPATRVVAGENHFCAILVDTTVSCWGSQGDWLGDSEVTDEIVGVIPDLETVKDLALGQDFSCALLTNAQVKCWGSNRHGLLGIGIAPIDPISSTSSPTLVSGLANVTNIEASGYAICALESSSRLMCWGKLGLAGDVPAEFQNMPTTIQDFSVAASSFGRGHICVIDEMLQLICKDTSGHFYGNHDSQYRVTGMTGTAKIDIGPKHSCAILDSGEAKCWGEISPAFSTSSPTSIAGLQSVSEIASRPQSGNGVGGACAIEDSGAIKCWGNVGLREWGTSLCGGGCEGRSNQALSLPHYSTTGIKLLQVPDRPESPTVTQRTASAIALVAAPFGIESNEAQIYVVQCSSDELTWRVCGTSNTSQILIENLIPAQSYSFRIAIRSEYGLSEFSEPTPIVLAANAPSIPMNVRLTQRSARSLGLEWSRPLDLGGLALEGYEIRFAQISLSPTNSINLEASQQSITLSDLEQGVAYTVEIRANNLDGPGPWVTLSNLVPDRLPKIGPTATRSGLSVHVRWDKPSEGGSTVIAYQVQYRTSVWSAWVDLPEEAPNATLGGNLYKQFSVADVLYSEAAQFRVRSRDEFSYSEWSDIVRIDLPGVPGIPSRPTTLRNGRNITISWSPPLSDGGARIVSYALQVSGDGLPWTNLLPSIDSSSLSATYTGTDASTKYFFRVAARNEVGRSDWSLASTETTQLVTSTPMPTPAPTSFRPQVHSRSQSIAFSAPTFIKKGKSHEIPLKSREGLRIKAETSTSSICSIVPDFANQKTKIGAKWVTKSVHAGWLLKSKKKGICRLVLSNQGSTSYAPLKMKYEIPIK